MSKVTILSSTEPPTLTLDTRLQALKISKTNYFLLPCRPLHTHAGLAASIVARQPGGEVSCEGVVHCSATACRCRHPMAEFRRLFASHG